MADNKSSKLILLGVVVIIIGILAIQSYVGYVKLTQAKKEVAACNSLLAQKDAAINEFVKQAKIKQDEVNSVKKELNSVKTDLDNAKKELAASKGRLPKSTK